MKPKAGHSVAALAILVCACTTSGKPLLSPAPAPTPEVLLVKDRQAVTGCTVIPPIQAKTLWGGFAKTGSAQTVAVKDLKKQALALGATHLLVVEVQNAAGSVDVSGEPYKCEVAAAPAAPQ